MSTESQPEELGDKWWPYWAACEEAGFVIDDNFIIFSKDVLKSPIDSFRKRKAARGICNLCPVFEECELNAEEYRKPEHMQYDRVFAGKVSILLPVIGVVRI